MCLLACMCVLQECVKSFTMRVFCSEHFDFIIAHTNGFNEVVVADTAIGRVLSAECSGQKYAGGIHIACDINICFYTYIYIYMCVCVFVQVNEFEISSDAQ